MNSRTMVYYRETIHWGATFTSSTSTKVTPSLCNISTFFLKLRPSGSVEPWNPPIHKLEMSSYYIVTKSYVFSPSVWSDATTRWQGTSGEYGFFLSEDPTARYALGEPIASARSLYVDTFPVYQKKICALAVCMGLWSFNFNSTLWYLFASFVNLIVERTDPACCLLRLHDAQR